MSAGGTAVAKKPSSVKIDADLHAEAKILAAMLGMDVGEYYTDRIRTCLDKDAADMGVDLKKLREKGAKKRPKPPSL